MPTFCDPSQPDEVAEALATLDVASPVVVEVVRLTWGRGLLPEAASELSGGLGRAMDNGNEDELACLY